jgi:putative heme iron utilization protein
MERDEILAYAVRLAGSQPGGTLATTHAEDGTPYLTYVLAHLLPDGRVLFGSQLKQQHSHNILATPEVSFLFDNRETIHYDWSAFDRMVVVGKARIVARESDEYLELLGYLREKSAMAAFFTTHGELFVIEPRRLVLSIGFEAVRHTVVFER